MDTPVSVVIGYVGETKKIEVVIDRNASSNNNNIATHEVKCEWKHLDQHNKVVMCMLHPTFTLKHCQDFQEHFKSRTISREMFLEKEANKPNYYCQIEEAIIHVMSNLPEKGLHACGYYEGCTG